MYDLKVFIRDRIMNPNKVNDFGRGLRLVLLSILMLILLVALPIRTVSAQGAARALDFEGTDDNVSCGNNASLDITSQITLEAWIFPSGTTPQGIVTKGDRTGILAYDLRVRGGGTNTVRGKIRTSTAEYEVESSTDVVDVGGWSHVALTYDNEDLRLFVNGVEEATNSDPSGDIITNTDNFVIGSWAVNPAYFNGQIDEVRIWDTALGESTIQEWMCKTVTNNPSDPHPNWSSMVSYWKLDESSVSDPGNAADSRARDYNNVGTYDVSMTDGDCVWSAAPIGNASISTTNGTGSISITTPSSRGEATVTINSGTPAIVQLYRVDNDSYADWPSADEAPPNPPGGTDHFDPMSYWGVFMSGGTSPNLAFQLDFTDHNGVPVQGEIDLYGRSDGSSTTFNLDDDNGDANYVVGNPSQSAYQRQYILTDELGNNPLPVELSSFTATTGDGTVTLYWRTETEVDNAGFSIYRSEERDNNYTKIAFVYGAGNSGMPIDYQFVDEKVEAGKTYFYYLEDVDIFGGKNKSEIIRLVRPVPGVSRLLQNYPNPFNPDTWLPYQLSDDSPVIIRIYNVSGQLIRIISLGQQKAGYHLNKSRAAYWDGKNATGQAVSTGVYFYHLKAGDFSAMRKMVILK